MSTFMLNSAKYYNLLHFIGPEPFITLKNDRLKNFIAWAVT